MLCSIRLNPTLRTSWHRFLAAFGLYGPSVSAAFGHRGLAARELPAYIFTVEVDCSVRPISDPVVRIATLLLSLRPICTAALGLGLPYGPRGLAGWQPRALTAQDYRQSLALADTTTFVASQLKTLQ